MTSLVLLITHIMLVSHSPHSPHSQHNIDQASLDIWVVRLRIFRHNSHLISDPMVSKEDLVTGKLEGL